MVFAVLGVLVAEITHHLFNRDLQFLYQRVEGFHAELLQTNRFERLLEASHEIKDQRAREEYKISLIEAAARSWLGNQVAGPPRSISKTNLSTTTENPRVM